MSFISANNKNQFIFFHEDKPSPRFDFSEVFSYRVLNLFSDASTTKTKYNTNGKRDYGCYGSIAVNKNIIIDKDCRIDNNCTTNLCEFNGLRMSLSYALNNINLYDKINIFSDSLYAVDTIRKYVYGYIYKRRNDCYGDLCKKSTTTPIANQSVIVECMDLYAKCLSINPQVRIFHQSGHVSINNYNSITDATYKFKTLNGIILPLDLNIIRYISYYNDVIDNYTRSVLRTERKKKEYNYPVEFFPMHNYREIE